jgi:hypothetical protein
MIARIAIALVFVASVGLSACGKLGDLEQPAPLFGSKAKADYEAQHQADAARARARAASEPPPPNDEATTSSEQPLTQAPYAPTIPGRNDTMPPQGEPSSLPQPGQPGTPQ